MSLFATDAMKFFAEQADRHNFRVEATSNWADMNDEELEAVQVCRLAQQPSPQRSAGDLPAIHGERRRMVSASTWPPYNDENSRWAVVQQFIGGGGIRHKRLAAVPAKLIVGRYR